MNDERAPVLRVLGFAGSLRA
ncbi:MAG: hypothetical protein AVDCRST_MAG89-5177, partial [uncultured Gemmatimonadetes bacterium]